MSIQGESEQRGGRPPYKPPQRKWTERKRKKARDSLDTVGQYGAAFVCGAVGGLIGWRWEVGFLPGLVVGAAFGYLFMTFLVVKGATAFARTFLGPSDATLPRKRDYSQAESFVSFGQFEDAIAAYEVAVAEHPEDCEPYIRIARLYRDKLARLDEAVFWFKRARKDAVMDGGHDLVVTREIIEIYRDKLAMPKRAIPELARIVERFPNDPQADWARKDLQELRDQLQRDHEEEKG